MTQQSKVEIYTWDHCPYCQKAISLLDSKGIQYTRYRIDGDESAREKMSTRANARKTVPQIFVNDIHMGGCDDIYALDSRGELDKLLFN